MDFTKQLVIKWILAPAIRLYIRITSILKNIYIYILHHVKANPRSSLAPALVHESDPKILPTGTI